MVGSIECFPMAQLYHLLYGKSKKKMHPIMTDVLHKCVNYRDSRKDSVSGWHEIVPAERNADVWRQKSATVGGNKCSPVARVGKNGRTTGLSGYIAKNGFNPHT